MHARPEWKEVISSEPMSVSKILRYRKKFLPPKHILVHFLKSLCSKCIVCAPSMPIIDHGDRVKNVEKSILKVWLCMCYRELCSPIQY